MREDAEKFFDRVITIYCGAERDLPRDAFEGLRGRQPESDRELDDWLSTEAGKLATIFVPTSALRWGAVGRS